MPYKDLEKRRIASLQAQRRWRSIPENHEKELVRSRIRDKANYREDPESFCSYEKIRWRKRQEAKFGVRYPTWWLCDICSKPISLFKGEIQLDHDYETGRFRGWLCRGCNGPLGRFEKFKVGFKEYLRW